MRYAVTVFAPRGYAHAGVFAEMAECLHAGLLALGCDSVLTHETALPGRRHIVLGANLLPLFPHRLAPDAILYNLEQADTGSSWFSPGYIALLKAHTVWDYSHHNAALLRSRGIEVKHVLPPAYTPALTRIQPVTLQDIDVLFYGSINQRRAELLDKLQASGLRVVATQNSYGRERDALIARAKLLLNLHFYDAQVLEVVRLSYLLANACAVLSEPGASAAENACWADGLAFAEPTGLVQVAQGLLGQAAERTALGERGLALMRRQPIAPLLQSALAASA